MNNKFKAGLIFIFGIVALVVILSTVGGTMTELNHEVKINVPVERAFSVLSDLESVQHYNPTVISASYISDEKVGVGSARVCDLGKDGKVKERVTDYKENEYIAMELYEHNWPLEFMAWRTQFQPTPEGTLVTQKMQYKMKFGVIGSLLDSLMMKKKMSSTLDSLFASMKAYIEK